MTSELQGNVVDLCPVGALTSKPYAFAARPWELNKTESIDVMDAVGSAIRVDTRGREVMRILPRVNEDVNEEWISDKTRHVVDGLRTQRLDQPYIREDGRLRPASWREAFDAIAAKVKGTRCRAHRRDRRRSRRGRGDLRAQGPDDAARRRQSRLPAGRRRARPEAGAGRPICSTPPSPASSRPMRCCIVGANPRREAAVLNARIRKRWRMGDFPIGLIGERADLTYPYDYLGAGPETLAEVAAGRQRLRRGAEEGRAAAGHRRHGRAGAAGRRRDRLARRESCARARRRSRTAGTASAVLHTAASRVGALDLGFVPGERRPQRRARWRRPAALDVAVPARRRRDRRRARRLRRLYRHPRRPRRAPRRRHPAGRGLSGEIRHLRQHRGARADGRRAPRSRPARRARTGRSCARCRTCSGTSCPTTRWRSCAQALFKAHPHLQRIDQIAPGDRGGHRARSPRSAARRDKAAFGSAIDDFYLTNPIARASADHGRMLGARRGPRRADRGGVGRSNGWPNSSPTTSGR